MAQSIKKTCLLHIKNLIVYTEREKENKTKTVSIKHEKSYEKDLYANTWLPCKHAIGAFTWVSSVELVVAEDIRMMFQKKWHSA